MQLEASQNPKPVLPDIETIRRAEKTLRRQVPVLGLGLDVVKEHLTKDVAPALNASSQSSRYYGFVTGGATPAAVFADNMVTEYDQNVQVHLPNETIATDVEAAALDMICDLVHLDPEDWTHRTFTTGATAANVIGLACAREHVVNTAMSRIGKDPHRDEPTVSSHGLFAAMAYAGINEIQILTTSPHSSLRKAASIVGLGHASVKDMGLHPEQPNRFDLNKLERALKESKAASIIAVSCSEVNSGLFATYCDDMLALRELADKYGAWIHVDAAFGLLARCLPFDPENNNNPFSRWPEYDFLRAGVQGIEQADSIAADAHKLFNVPYDCGIFLSRHLKTATDVFQNPGAPYLNAEAGSVPSPLNIGIENSRRFRALPVYANLLTLGRKGFIDLLESQIALARAIAEFIDNSDVYELLPLENSGQVVHGYRNIYVIVLFRLKDYTSMANTDLVRRINSSRKVYVSGTTWRSYPACRFAVSNWQSSIEKDFKVIEEVLETVARGDD